MTPISAEAIMRPEPPPKRGLAHFAVGILLNIVVFVAIGPLVGCVAFFLVAGFVSNGLAGIAAGAYGLIALARISHTAVA